MEKRELNIIIGKCGGNASKNSLNYKITLPTSWAKELGITRESRKLIATFDGERIVFTKAD